MTDTTERADPAATWPVTLQTLAATTPDEVELEVQGRIPPGLAGTLYRIGPARHDVFGERYGHLFDGDGAVHALRIADGRVRYRSAWVAMDATREEQAAGRRLWGGGFWTPPAGGPLGRVRRMRKNVANINVIPSGDRLLALSEGGLPVAVDRRTLTTLGDDDLGGVLRPGDGFSAHPKVDRATGEVWNFGVRYGARTTLTVYRADPAGAWSTHASVPLGRGHMIHDMALTERSVVIVCVPFVLPRIPLRLLAGRQGYGQALRWEPDLGTRVLVVDRATGALRRYRADPLFTFHVAAARDDGDDVEIELCAYDDPSVVARLASVMGGAPSRAEPAFERLTVRPDGTSSRRALAALPFEFPRTGPEGTVVGATFSDASPLPDVPCAIGPDGRVTVADLAPGCFAGEPVPTRDGSVLTLVTDGPRRRTELRIYPPDLGPPVATVALPHLVPFGLHGNFVADPG